MSLVRSSRSYLAISTLQPLRKKRNKRRKYPLGRRMIPKRNRLPRPLGGRDSAGGSARQSQGVLRGEEGEASWSLRYDWGSDFYAEGHGQKYPVREPELLRR